MIALIELNNESNDYRIDNCKYNKSFDYYSKTLIIVQICCYATNNTDIANAEPMADVYIQVRSMYRRHGLLIVNLLQFGTLVYPLIQWPVIK